MITRRVDSSKRMIFENERVETLCHQFKRNRDFQTYQRICEETNNLMDSIIRRQRYHTHAPFDDIKNFLFLQLERWIDKWVPVRGKVYTYFSTCIKHGAISYVTKETMLRQRLAFTDAPLDALTEDRDEISLSGDFKEEVTKAVHRIVVRWHEPVIREVLKYNIHAILNNRASTRRRYIIHTVQDGWGLDSNMAKFLLDWSLGAVRSSVVELFDVPITHEDVIRAREKFTFIPDIADIIGWDNTKKLMVRFAGMNVKFPSLMQVRRHNVIHQAYNKMSSDPSVDTLNRVVAKSRINEDKLESDLIDLATSLQEGVLEDSPLFDDGDFSDYILDGLV